MNTSYYKILRTLFWIAGLMFVAAISYICYTLGASLNNNPSRNDMIPTTALTAPMTFPATLNCSFMDSFR